MIKESITYYLVSTVGGRYLGTMPVYHNEDPHTKAQTWFAAEKHQCDLEIQKVDTDANTKSNN